ncbi:hypothetical protein N826_32000 [Skermanella aerolata KACC 11604]|nr:hypothetical protein N826_32000 [Skermanella aerolata KACC 11604]
MYGPSRKGWPWPRLARHRLDRLTLLSLILPTAFSSDTNAHAVAEEDKGYIQEIRGIYLLPCIYLGIKHMVAGYDHRLFLFRIIFFLYRLSHSKSMSACSQPGIS